MDDMEKFTDTTRNRDVLLLNGLPIHVKRMFEILASLTHHVKVQGAYHVGKKSKELQTISVASDTINCSPMVIPI